MMKMLSGMLCVVVLAGCNASNPVVAEDAQPASSIRKPADEQSAVMQLWQQAKDRWDAQQAGHYIYTLHYTPAFNRPIRIRVQDDAVVQAMTVPDNAPLPSERSTQILTVEDLFAVARNELEGNDKIQVVYDRDYGYPVFITRGGKDGGKYKASGMRLLK